MNNVVVAFLFVIDNKMKTKNPTHDNILKKKKKETFPMYDNILKCVFDLHEK